MTNAAEGAPTGAPDDDLLSLVIEQARRMFIQEGGSLDPSLLVVTDAGPEGGKIANLPSTSAGRRAAMRAIGQQCRGKAVTSVIFVSDAYLGPPNPGGGSLADHPASTEAVHAEEMTADGSSRTLMYEYKRVVTLEHGTTFQWEPRQEYLDDGGGSYTLREFYVGLRG